MSLSGVKVITEDQDKRTEQELMPRREPVVVDVAQLFRGAREIRLRHHNEEYRLRLTKANKLILTK